MWAKKAAYEPMPTCTRTTRDNHEGTDPLSGKRWFAIEPTWILERGFDQKGDTFGPIGRIAQNRTSGRHDENLGHGFERVNFFVWKIDKRRLCMTIGPHSRGLSPSAPSNSLSSGTSIAAMAIPKAPATTRKGKKGSADSGDPGLPISTLMTA
jgi:hypothetical protein